LLEAWILQADWSLLQAKEAGRDRVMVGKTPRSHELKPHGDNTAAQ
jgi:hypothetical protein